MTTIKVCIVLVCCAGMLLWLWPAGAASHAGDAGVSPVEQVQSVTSVHAHTGAGHKTDTVAVHALTVEEVPTPAAEPADAVVEGEVGAQAAGEAAFELIVSGGRVQADNAVSASTIRYRSVVVNPLLQNMLQDGQSFEIGQKLVLRPFDGIRFDAVIQHRSLTPSGQVYSAEISGDASAHLDLMIGAKSVNIRYDSAQGSYRYVLAQGQEHDTIYCLEVDRAHEKVLHAQREKEFAGESADEHHGHNHDQHLLRDASGNPVRGMIGGAAFMPADLIDSSFKTQFLALDQQAQALAIVALRKRSFPLADLNSLSVDRRGSLFYTCEIDVAEAPIETDAATTATATGPQIAALDVPVSTPPIRHSKAGASNVIYLDFNGGTVTGTAWNVGGGTEPSYNVKPWAYQGDADYTTFNDDEQAGIIEIWERVSEHFRPFNVDVTTEEPSSFGSTTAHAMFTEANDDGGLALPHNGSGGVAYVDVWGESDFHSWYAPAWVKGAASGAYSTLSGIANAASHEVGHNLSLNHDGFGSLGYYDGHTNGSISWGPLMGNGRRNVMQWSKGDYASSTNTSEDDVSLISDRIGYRADDHGDTTATASTLKMSGDAVTISDSGIIERTDDPDVFSFTTAAGSITVNATAFHQSYTGTWGSSLDIKLEIRDAAGTLMAEHDSLSDVNATITTTLAAGTYYAWVIPVGVGSPMDSTPSGYTSYGSLGYYDLSGSIIAPGREIDVTGNAVGIINGDTTPSTSDDTAFGDVAVSASISKTFTIKNVGGALLTLSGSPLVRINGSADFSVTTQPTTSAYAPAVSDTFVVRYAPSATGSDSATISIANNDSDENPYTFIVSGSAVSGVVSHDSVAFTEANANDGSIDHTSPYTVTLTGSETFTGSDGDDFVSVGKVTVTGIPAGLTAVFTRNSSTQLTITLTGNATNHATFNDVTGITFVYNNSAFAGNDAASVLGTSVSNATIDFVGVTVTTNLDTGDDATIGASLSADAADGGGLSLREAVSWAASGDFVDFASGISLITLGSEILIDKSLTIDGPGQTGLSMSGNNATRLFYLYKSSSTVDVTMQNVTLTNAMNSMTGSAAYGGAIYSRTANLTLTNVTISGCTVSATPDSASTRSSYGGAVYQRIGTLTITDCIIQNNTATGVDANSGVGRGYGGGVYVATGVNTVDISGTSMTGNMAIAASSTASDGGALFLKENAVTTMSDCIISGNSTVDAGGGIYSASSSLTISNTPFTNNSSKNGAGLYVSGTAASLNVSNSTLSSNTAGDNGGALYVSSNDVTISGSTFSANTALDGGAIYQYAKDLTGNPALTMISTTSFSSNTAVNTAGAYYILTAANAYVETVIDSCVFSGNSVTKNNTCYGGAMYVSTSSDGNVDLTIKNSTLSGNFVNKTVASGVSRGGALYISRSTGGTNAAVQNVKIYNSTLANNQVLSTADTADEAGGGIYLNAGHLIIDSCILADNAVSTTTNGPDVYWKSPAADLSRSSLTVAYSLIENADGGHGVTDGVNKCIVGSDPALATLADNGGPTLTHALGNASVCIDAGRNTLSLTVDQRGTDFARVMNTTTDMGALEEQSVTSAPEMEVTRGTAVADGATDAVTATVAGQLTTITYALANTGAANLTLTTPVTISSISNCSIGTITQPASTVAASGNTTLVIPVTPTAAGAWSFTVSIVNNDSDENPYNWTVSGTATAVPPTTPATPTITINDVTTLEGNSGTTNAVFTVTLSAVHTSDVSVNYATSNGNASAGSDYVSTSGTLVINAGNISGTITVPVNGDRIDETNESYTVALSTPTNATIVDGTAVGTITDDDAVPTLSIANVSVTEGNSDIVTATFTVSLSAASDKTVVVNYATSDGTATTADSDYVASTGTATIPAGGTTAILSITIIGDTTLEADETYIVTLSSPVNATLGTASATGTIVNDEAVPTVVLSIDTINILEAAGSAVVSATLSATSLLDTTVNLAYTGTASATDYSASARRITILAGATTGSITLTAIQDTLEETDETIIVDVDTLVNASEPSIQQVTVSITDDDVMPTLSIDDQTVTEGHSGSVTAIFTLTLSAASGQDVRVDYITADDTTTELDYGATSGTATIPAGAVSTIISVVVTGDIAIENDEIYYVNLSNVINATLSDAQGQGTITSDDSSVSLSFQPSMSPATTGYELTDGSIYQIRSNTHAYGWNQNMTERMRDRNDDALQERDTMALMDVLTGQSQPVWEIELPNGVYDVTIVAGDPRHFESTMIFDVEGTTMINLGTSSSTAYQEETARLTVSDGKLTIMNGTGAINNKICSLSLTLVPPAVSLTAPLAPIPTVNN